MWKEDDGSDSNEKVEALRLLLNALFIKKDDARAETEKGGSVLLQPVEAHHFSRPMPNTLSQITENARGRENDQCQVSAFTLIQTKYTI